MLRLIADVDNTKFAESNLAITLQKPVEANRLNQRVSQVAVSVSADAATAESALHGQFQGMFLN